MHVMNELGEFLIIQKITEGILCFTLAITHKNVSYLVLLDDRIKI